MRPLPLWLKSGRVQTGLVIIFILAVCAIFAPYLAPNDPNEQNLSDIYTVSATHAGSPAKSLPVGRVDARASTLLKVTEEALFHGIDAVKPGARVSDIGAAVQWVLARQGIFLNSVGDVGLLPLVLKAAAAPRAVDDSTIAGLSERAGLSSIFGL